MDDLSIPFLYKTRNFSFEKIFPTYYFYYNITTVIMEERMERNQYKINKKKKT